MTDKFIAVANKQEADRAAKYLESLGYVLSDNNAEDSYNERIDCLSTVDNDYYYSDLPPDYHSDVFEEEQLFVPDYFEPAQEPKEEYVLSGVWQFFDPLYNSWSVGMNTHNHRYNTEEAGYQTRDLYIKV